MGVFYNQRETNFETYGFPGLVFDFARAGNQRDGISKRTDYISIGRTTTGTYVNSSGFITTAAAYEPRFDYNPTTGKCNGLIIEVSRTNEISNSMPTTSGGTGITNTLVSDLPGIFSTGRRLTSGGGNDVRIIVGTNTLNVVFTYSFFARAGTQGSYVFLRNGTGPAASWNLNTNTVTGDSFGTAKIENYGNGWWRCYATITGSGSSGFLLGVGDSGLNSANGDNIIIAGVQIERGTFPTSYIPTSGSTVTRGADNPIIITPSFYNSSTSAISIQYKPYVGIVTTTQPLLSFDDDTTNNEIKVSVAGTSPTLTVVNAGVTTVSISTIPNVTVANQEYGVSLSAKNNQFTLTSEGVGIITTTSGTLPTGITTVRLGHDKAGNAFNGYISKLVYYPRELSTPALKVFSDVSYQGKIVTDGLVLNLDAGNPKSYPGSGTVWYDRANNNNGTLTNGPTYSSADGGSIVFDGTNDYVSCGNPSSLQITQGTISAWVKTSNPGSSYRSIIAKQLNYGLFVKDGILITYDWGSGLDRTTGINISDGNWKNVVMSFTTNTGTPSNNAIIYLNGNSILRTTVKLLNNDIEFQIGQGGTSGPPNQYINGNIAQVSIYNRALSASEIQQNFNSLRGRFGI